MSAVKFRLKLAREARADFGNALSFTLQKWGQGQLAEYKRKIDDALSAIAANPQSGRKKYGFMVYSVERHRIFYRVDKSTIYVLRILHDRMDTARHLPER